MQEKSGISPVLLSYKPIYSRYMGQTYSTLIYENYYFLTPLNSVPKTPVMDTNLPASVCLQPKDKLIVSLYAIRAALVAILILNLPVSIRWIAATRSTYWRQLENHEQWFIEIFKWPGTTGESMASCVSTKMIRLSILTCSFAVGWKPHFIWDNPALENITGISSMEHMPGGYFKKQPTAFDRRIYQSLSLDVLYILNNASLNPSTVWTSHQHKWTVRIGGNDSLLNISGFDSLQNVKGT